MQDIELVCDNGRFFFVQTRDNSNSVTPLAALVASIDMVSEGLTTEDDVFQRASELQLLCLKEYYEAPIVKQSSKCKAIAKGIPFSPGIGSGPVSVGDKYDEEYPLGSVPVLKKPYEFLGRFADFTVILQRVNAVVSRYGGFSDHAAQAVRIASMEQGIIKPYVISARPLTVKEDIAEFGDVQIREGDVITVDGNTGDIYLGLTNADFEDSEVTKILKGAASARDSKQYQYYQTVLRWLELKKKKMLPSHGTKSSPAGKDELGVATARQDSEKEPELATQITGFSDTINPSLDKAFHVAA